MKKSMKRFLPLLLVFLLAISAVGCSKTDDASNTTGNSQGDQEVKEVKDTLIVANQNDAKSLDLHEAGDSGSVNALNPIYETLLRYDENGELYGVLAESWEWVDDLTLEVKLKKGVKFHNGEEMKASDVVFSYKRATSPAGVKVQYIMAAIDPDGVVAVDDYTVRIKTLEPFSPLVGYLPYIGAAIASEKEFTENPNASKEPCGTGPYKFVEWKKNDRVVYERFDGYHGEAPYFKNLILRTIVESNSRIIELESGSIDIAYFISPTDVKRLEANPNTKVLTSDSTTFQYYGFNTSKKPFDDVRVRQAFDYAVDKNLLLQGVYRGFAQYTPGAVTPNMKYYDTSDTKQRYDVEKAKELLADAGYLNGFKTSIAIRENKESTDAATILQAELAKVGIELEIKVFESGAFYDYVMAGEHDLYIAGWGAVGFPEPDNNIYGPSHSSGIPTNNYTFWAYGPLDKLLEQSRTIKDGPEREQIVMDVQKMFRENVPYITYANTKQLIGVRSNIEGFRVTPAKSHYMQGARLAE